MSLPPLFVITDQAAAARAGRSIPQVVAAALAGGAPAILLRDKELPRAVRRELGGRLAPLVRAAGAQLWVTGDADLATELHADGLHLPADHRRPTGWRQPFSRSCHDRVEVERARADGAAHAFVAPVAPTPSKPGYGPALGVEGLRHLVEVADVLPVVALGGVRPDNAGDWRSAGAAGVAVMGGVMAADDPTDVVRALLTAWEGEPRPDHTSAPASSPTPRPSESA